MFGNFSITNECGVLFEILYPGLGKLRETWYGVLDAARNTMSVVKIAKGDDIVGTMALMPATACNEATLKGRYTFASTYSYPAGNSESRSPDANSNYIGEEYYDGVKNVYGIQSLGTVPSSSPLLRQTFNGLYGVKPDCTVIASFGYFQIIMTDLSQWYISTNIHNGFDFGWAPKGLA